ncbi:uncharacterized protein LOC115919264 [Strongylocentrotus purpuratus]|uniref:Tyr recombinase domain-containing protein n=1 Tax=Strongylocentrotus purpuratus TaxID=7668 RepID=A0A7M7SSN0_STRPU|nr:uncharacterized protein LOC115919264 [Strongylocentrotus purpuratus]
MTFFCNQGWENIRSMKPSHFTVTTDENGRRYMSKRDCLTKNNREDEDDSSNCGLMYEMPMNDKCPVKSYLMYVSKLNSKCTFLWQKPKSKAPQQDGAPGYDSSPVGVNTIANKVKEISKKAGCKQTYTNHHLRAICISSLDGAGFETRDIMRMSGHRSASSLKHYSTTSEKRKRGMSGQLS